MNWYYGWNVILVSLLFQAVLTGLGIYSFTFWVGPWMETFGASRGEIMIAATATILGNGAMAPFAGRAMDRFPIRILMCAGALGVALGFLLLSFATAVWQIVVIHAVLIAGGVILAGPVVGQALAAKWFTERRGRAIGIASIGTSIGGFLMPPMVTSLLQAFDWRVSCLICGLLALAITPLAWFIVRNSPTGGPLPDPSSAAGQGGQARRDSGLSTLDIVRNRNFMILAVSFLVPTLVATGVMQNFGPLSDDLGFSQSQAAVLMSSLAGAMLVGKLSFGLLSEKIDNRYLYWVAVGALAIAAVLLRGHIPFGVAVVSAILIGIMMGGILPLTGAIISTRFGAAVFGQVMGLVYFVITLSAAGPVLVGWLRDTTGSYDASLSAALVILAPAAVLMAFLPRAGGPHGRPV